MRSLSPLQTERPAHSPFTGPQGRVLIHGYPLRVGHHELREFGFDVQAEEAKVEETIKLFRSYLGARIGSNNTAELTAMIEALL